MLAALQLDVLTLATCWNVTRTDGTQYFFTSNSRDLVIDGNTYVASTGMNASAIDSNEDLSVDNLEVIGALTSSSITDADLIGGKWDYAAIQIFQVDYTNLALGKNILRTGTLGTISSMRNSYKAELRGMAQPFAEFFGRSYSPSCDTDLGSSRCTVNLAPLTFSDTLTSVVSQTSIVSSGLAGKGTDYFVGGLFTLNAGDNSGISKEIKSYNTATGAFTFQEAFPYSLIPGQSVTTVAGCDKSRDTCKNRFNNIINFQGFPDIPGIDGMMKQGGVS
jgi:uncharacterized phage protein (TIGR02218 family)